MIVEYSSMCINESNYRQKIDEARELLLKEGIQFGIQIHNSITREFYEKLLPYRKEIPFSVHSPVLSKYFLNIAANDYNTIAQTFEAGKQYTSQCGTKLFFFHGFFMTDVPIVMDMVNYRKAILDGVGEDYCYKNSFIMDPEYFESDAFIKYKESFKNNYKRLVSDNKDCVISMENDFVGIGSGLQRPQEILELIDNLYFDVGHFWTSSIVHGFDYIEASQELIAQKNIVGCHIQRNMMPRDIAWENIRDSHRHIYDHSEHDVESVTKMLINKGLETLTLEIRDGNIDDIKTLLGWL